MKNVAERISEIEELVASNDLNLATKRLMDLAMDFSGRNDGYKREVISIRATYNELREEIRVEGKTDRNILRTKHLRNQILELCGNIADRLASERAALERNITGPARMSMPDMEEDQAGRTQLELEKELFLRNKRNRPVTDTVFQAREISKSFGDKHVSFTLQPINLELRLNQITAVVGENGSGKSTLLQIAAGMINVEKGEIAYPHFESNGSTDLYLIKQQIAYIPQQLSAWPGLLIDNLHFSALIHGIKGRENEAEVDFIVNRLGLEKYRKASWGEISGGFKMRFALAKALVWNPRLVILDEPLANLDVNTQLLFLQDIRNLANSVANPMSVLISSQHLHEVESIADNIIFLRDGKTLYNGSLDDFGEERTENIYEIGCDLSKEEMLDFLDETDFRLRGVDGSNYVICTSVDITETQLIKILVEKKVRMNYFRDISRSTRKLFKVNDL